MIATSQIRGRLQPYLPRLTFEWLAEDPSRRWRTLEGSVVFVDISGFTKLSEKLAKAGKVGAEQMADAINHCFTELLAIAYNEDGSLIKFGGDALFLLFTGGPPDDHALRASRAAAGMRKRLREVGKIETPRGSVGLRMSVGVHTGEFDFFLVGGSHRELLVTGPGTTQVVAMEGTAGAGEILLSPATAALLPASCVGSAKGPGFLLRATPPGDPPGLVTVIPHIPDELLESCVSVANREQLLAGSREPEHRQASVAFLHFDETDEMRTEQGPGALADALHELTVAVQEAADAFQVSFLASDVDLDGGKIILTAGVPRAVGDDEERMLLALRRIADARYKVPLRIGVNRGPVFSGDIGPRYRRTFTVMGDTVNLAARVMSQAPPGQLYATGSILDLSGTRFEVSELEPFMVKGKVKPVRAWAVGAPIGSRTRDAARSLALPLVGRREELDTLHGFAEAARRGEGHLVEIVGEPGIGKSRLLEELREIEGDLRPLHATAEAYTSTIPYATWRELLRELLGIGWDDPDEAVADRLRLEVMTSCPDLMPWLPLLADAIGAEVSSTAEVDAIAPEFRPAKLHEVLARFLETTMVTPTLIQVEDAHLMDPASADLLSSLTSELRRRPWLVCLALRTADPGSRAPEDRNIARIDLAPLAEDATREMVLAATESAPLLPHDEQLVGRRSGGNPQFILDLVQALASGSMLPESVEAAATARIDSLSPGDRTLVRRASVFGTSFHPRSLGVVLDDETPLPDAQTWDRLTEFFEADGEEHLRFRRAVVRDAAYQGLPFRIRRALHGTVGAQLEGEASDPDEIAGLLSLHFFLAADYERALRYARLAAERAASRYALQEAAHLYQRAIDAARRLPVVSEEVLGDLFEAQSAAYFDAGDFRKASDASAAARRAYRSDPLGLGRMLYIRSRIEDRLGAQSGALRWATRARTVLSLTDAPAARSLEAELAAWYASLLRGLGRNAKSTRWTQIAIFEAEASGNRVALADAYDVLDTLNFVHGRPSGDHWTQALKIFEELGDLRAQVRILGNLGAGRYMEGRWDEAMSSYERAHGLAEQIGDVVSDAVLLTNMAEIFTERGALGEAETLLREALRVSRAAGFGYSVASCLNFLGRVIARAGRFDEALALYAQAEGEFSAAGAREEALDVQVRVAECFTYQLEPSQALARLEAVTDGSAEGSMSAALIHRVRGYALAQLGDIERARKEFEEGLAVSRSRGADFEVSEAITGLIRLGRLDHVEPPSTLVDEWNAILRRLRILAVTCVPLPRSK